MPMLPNLNLESWKYSNINAALKKLDVVERQPVWEMTGAYEFLNDVHSIIIPQNKIVVHPIDIRLIGVRWQNPTTTLNISVEWAQS